MILVQALLLHQDLLRYHQQEMGTWWHQELPQAPTGEAGLSMPDLGVLAEAEDDHAGIPEEGAVGDDARSGEAVLEMCRHLVYPPYINRSRRVLRLTCLAALVVIGSFLTCFVSLHWVRLF